MGSHNGVRCPGAQEKHDPHARWRVLGVVSMGAFSVPGCFKGLVRSESPTVSMLCAAWLMG